MSKKVNLISLGVYIFGEHKEITVKTEYTIEEIENDWELREKLVYDYLVQNAIVQSDIGYIGSVNVK